ncbi:hypothetical protein PFICI_01943 [Pestalotiopsis fici W106-1]|uniref:Tat pathway signal sequence protein n=1 Tax=Pestalotiopsis fici (strain W106-1 / CGMCC3.15140) TaxID=1229662 RepID=W3XQ75_PESFW|nr:uncharacterized protein PFICI_01943 [Pestalotiopsis fici W106-1]ETS88115.1 hypothetical protein PFICI_01943 [Pestalotiopsis fici W106-1]
MHVANLSIVTPAQGAISWETMFLDAPLKGSSIYVGDPKPEIDDAWGDLVRYANTRVQAEDLERINRTSVPLNDAEGGFLVNLNVFHHLHCLNKIRKQLYNDYYQDWHSPSAQLEHVNHCIEYLRQVVMCNADITMQTFDWIDDYRRPWPNFKIQHECKNWDALTDWAKEHSVPSLIGPIITHPVLGVSWREDDIH